MNTSVTARLRFLITAGIGLFCDGYLNISIGLVVPMLGYLYFPDGEVAAVPSDIMKGSLSLGMVAGQLFFGFLGDTLGRSKVYGKELIITMVGTLLLILMPWGSFSSNSVVAWVACFRVMTGFGVGGDYPMTSSLSAEKDYFGSRAKQVLLVFASIGVGATTSGLVYLILLEAFKTSIEHNINRLQWVWRLLFGLGLIPAALTLYARLTIKESEPYQDYVAKETSLTNSVGRGIDQQFQDFREYFSQWKHAKVLFATSLSWFLFDIAYYGINLNQSVILTEIGYATGATKWETLHNTAIGNLIVSAAGYLPGFYLGIFLPDLIGRVRQQFIGCALVAVLYAVWAGVTHHTSTGGLIALFTLSQLTLNAGPNATTFLIPVEVFPTRVRGTAHGIAAASGKCGAVLTAFAFGSATDAIGLSGVLGLFSGIMAVTAAVTLLIPETKGRTLDDIECEVLYKSSSSLAATSVISEVSRVEVTDEKWMTN